MEQLKNAAGALRGSGLALLKELIAADSTNIDHGVGGNERNAQRVVRKKLEALGMEIDQFEPDPETLARYEEAGRGHRYEGRPNVVGIRKGSGGGRSLILNGHIDTMPFDHVEQWVTPPLSPKELDGRLYGRGACDMKGGIAAMLTALDCIDRAGISLRGDVIFQSVVDEEGGGNGSFACAARGYRADGAIIAEPTQLEIMPAHMGWLFYKLEVTGRALHSSMKWNGVNAIEKTMKYMQALQELERLWAISKRSAMLPPPTINFGTIHGGMAGSVVADRCVLDFGLHYLPADADEKGLGTKVDAEIRELVRQVSASDAWLREHPPVLTLYQQGSGYQISPGHPLVQILKENSLSHLGRASVRGCEYGSDARILANYAGTPAVLFGPGSILRAHAINEYVELDQFYSAVEILAETIAAWCNGPGEDQNER